MKSIFVVALVSLAAVLILTRLYLLNDLCRLFGRYSRRLFSFQSLTYYSELAVTILIVVLLAIGAAAVQSAAAAIFSLVTTNNIAEFCITYRGVFSFYTSDIQSPGRHILWLFVSPFFKLLSVLVLAWSVRCYFLSINKLYKRRIYSESDCFYFSLLSVAILFGFSIFMHSQSIKSLNMVSNCLYVILQNLSLFLFFFSYYWIISKEEHYLADGIEKYLLMGKIEKTVIAAPWKTMVFTYLFSVVLTIPCYLGLQWQPNNKLLMSLFVLVGIGAFFLTKWTFARSWNYLSAVLFDSTLEKSLIETKTMKHSKRRGVVLCSLAVMAFLIFSLFYSKSMFLFFFLLLCLIVMSMVFILVVYGLVLLAGVIVTVFKGAKPANDYWSVFLKYIKNTTISFASSLKLGCSFIFVAFILITVFPKSLDCSRINSNNNCVVDPNGVVLWVDEEHERYFAPITSSNEVPQEYVDMLLFQEDRCFREQNSYLPNKSNWHGLSPAILKRGGSNINCQIVKQMTYFDSPGFPRDGSRKICDMIGSYQLSLQYSLDELLDFYLNISSFNGARGYQGINSACLYTFGCNVCEINSLEMLFLISTLPRATYLTDGERRIAYTRAPDEPELTKSILLQKAKRWLTEGLITNHEYGQFCNDSLRFSNHRYKCESLPVGTRLMFANHFIDSPGRHDCTISLENEKALEAAYNLLRARDVFRKNGSELQVAALVVEASSGKIIGHFSSSDVLDYANKYTYPIGSLGKPAIILELLKAGAPSDFRLFDGKRQSRKTPHNSHGWSNRYVGLETILSNSLNAPFSNIYDLGLNPRTVFQNLEKDYASMNIAIDTVGPNDSYNYPLGLREMKVADIAQIYQTIFNNGLFVPLSLEQHEGSVTSKRIWDENHVHVVKNALRHTIDSNGGTLHRYKNDLPSGKTFYGKTGTSSRQKYFWTVLSDGDIVIVSWATYGKQTNDAMALGTEKSWGASAAGLFAILVYNELYKTHNFKM